MDPGTELFRGLSVIYDRIPGITNLYTKRAYTGSTLHIPAVAIPNLPECGKLHLYQIVAAGSCGEVIPPAAK